MTDIWACSSCHSINRQRDQRCYRCGARQDEATGEMADVRAQLALQTRAVVPYRSSWLRAVVASAFIAAVAVLGIVVLVLSLDAVWFLRDQIDIAVQTGEIDQAEFVRRAAPALVPGLAQQVCALGALVFFAAWLSRAVENVPALGGGTPGTTPTKALVYPFIPIVNLIKVPPMIQDVLYRLDPKAGGFFMILIAWVGLVGSAIVSVVVDWWVNIRIASIARNATTLGEAIEDLRAAFDIQIYVDIATTIAVSIGAVILVVVILRIERRARARDREIRAAALAPAASQGTLPAATPPVVAPPPVIGTAVLTTAPPDPAPAPTSSSASTAPPDPSLMPAAAVPPVLAPADPASSPGSPEEAAPSAGPRLLVRVAGGRVEVSIGGDDWEASSSQEVRDAGPALRDAGGSAEVRALELTAATIEQVDDIARALRDAGVPTTVATQRA